MSAHFSGFNASVERFRAWVVQSAVRDASVTWALCFGAILLSWLIAKPIAKLVATVGFLYLPVLGMALRGEDYRDFGLSTRNLRRDLMQFLAMSAVVFPVFIAGYLAFIWLFPRLPKDLLVILTPYELAPRFAWRLPDRFFEWVIDQTFVVALPEEFFYRGYLYTRLRDAWPEGRLVLGARVGKAFWVTAVLFALGHLAIFQVWRLAVFFPALLFGWMRERSGSVVGAALFHAASNLLVQVLDACFFGR
jgi:membrane protease YdiL (CAAX protease family)